MGHFIESKYGNAILKDTKGYFYLVNNRAKKCDKIFWKCREYKKLKCYAKATTTGVYVSEWRGEHNHPPVPRGRVGTALVFD